MSRSLLCDVVMRNVMVLRQSMACRAAALYVEICTGEWKDLCEFSMVEGKMLRKRMSHVNLLDYNRFMILHVKLPSRSGFAAFSALTRNLAYFSSSVIDCVEWSGGQPWLGESVPPSNWTQTAQTSISSSCLYEALFILFWGCFYELLSQSMLDRELFLEWVNQISGWLELTL